MHIKEEKGLAGIDIAISVIIITIFVAMIGNLIVNTNLNSKKAERKNTATSYAVKEIEQIKAQGYISDYNQKGINNEETLKEEDIIENNKVTGYHKKVTIKDYVLITENTEKQSNLLKEITVEISYKIANKDENIKISTYIAKE